MRACVRGVFAIYDNNIIPRLIMMIIKIIIPYFIQITRTDDFPSTGTRLRDINVGEMLFIPMNVNNELFNGVRQLRWQHLSPEVSTFSHEALHPPSAFLSLSVVGGLSQPVFLIRGLSSRFGDVDVFFLQPKVLCS